MITVSWKSICDCLLANLHYLLVIHIPEAFVDVRLLTRTADGVCTDFISFNYLAVTKFERNL